MNQTDHAENDALDIVITYDEGTFTATCSLGCNWGEVTWECDDTETTCSTRLTESGVEGTSSSQDE